MKKLENISYFRLVLAILCISHIFKQIGDVVGYSVRLHSVLPRYDYACVLFCSIGIMLRRLLTDPYMSGVSHIIIDEAHERSLDTDLMLLMTKRALQHNSNLKVIIMSATINPELFQNYFQNSVVLHIPGFTHHVEPHFLDKKMAESIGMNFNSNRSITPVIDVKSVAKLVSLIHQNKPDGAILVFLPGWAEISKLRRELTDFYSSDLVIIPVHSRLSPDEQRKMFMRLPTGQGQRKVILSTNIAETSITIDDVKYVIDTGAHKEERLSSSEGMLSSLDNQWISKASALQRRGRAGRTEPGECYHLFSEEKFESLDMFPLAEVHRIRLESTVLNSKIYSGNEKAEQFLAQLPEPPSVAVIHEAIEKLQWAGALDELEGLTPLGIRIVKFTTHPLLSKALIHAYLFKCVNPMLTICTILSNEIELFPNTLGDKTDVRKSKKHFSNSSDHLALAWMFQQWDSYDTNEGETTARWFMEENKASHEAFSFIRRVRNQVANHVVHSGLMSEFHSLKDLSSDCNLHSSNNELIKGVLLSGVGNILFSRDWDVYKGVVKKKTNLITGLGHRAALSGESVNYKKRNFSSPFMTYFNEVQMVQQRSVVIRETSIISPLTLVLFQCAEVKINECEGNAENLKLKDNEVILSLMVWNKVVNVICEHQTAEMILKLRSILWKLISYKVREEGVPQYEELFVEVDVHFDKLLKLLSDMLQEQNGNIERMEEKEKEE